MKALKELVSLITRHKRKQVEILGYNEDSTNRYELFYGLIESGRLDSDEDAARYFFGPDKDGRFTQYRNLRNGLFKRLVNTFFFIDLKKPEFNDAQAAAHSCRKYSAAARMLAARGARHAAFELAQKTITPAIRFELTETVLDLARYLRHYFAFVKPDDAKRKYYEGLIKTNMAILELSVKAEGMYYSLISPYIKSRSSKPWVGEQARAYLKELDPLMKGCDAYWPRLYYFLIAKLERASIHDYEGTIKLCRQAIGYLEGKAAATNPILAAFYHSLIIALTMLECYEEAEIAVRRAEKLTAPGTHNWFKGLEQELVLYFFQKKYLCAYRVYEKATEHSQFSLLPATEQESWKIYEGYFHLLTEARKIILPSDASFKKGFRPSRFLNEVSEFSKDKQGMNIPVLIIHALFLLHQNRYDESYDRILALAKYADRHLREARGTFRSYCFIKAIMQIPKADFLAKASEERATSWLERMNATPLQLADTPHEIEPIPYEHLWDIALEALGPRRREAC